MPRLLVAALLACLVGAVPAHAQMETREGIALQNQILELRQQLDTLRQQQGSMPAPVPRGRGNGAGMNASQDNLLSSLLDRVSSLEDTVRTLTGRVDELSNRLQKTQADLGKQISDLSFQMQNGGGRPAGADTAANATGGGYGTSYPAQGPTSLAPPSMSPGPGNLGTVPAQTPRETAPRTPENALQAGYAALSRRDYPAAEAAAREVVAAKGPRAYDGQYLLAQALAGQRSYQAAALAYDDTYARSRNGAHAAESLLGLASSLASINQKPAACASLDKLHAEFPSLRPALREEAAITRQRAGCR